MPGKKREYGDGSLRTLPSGKFEASYRFRDGSRPHKSFTKKSEAQAWLRQQRDNAHSEAGPLPRRVVD